ncbi:MAG: hypothetical protein JEZ04_11665 [Spirochaetales bacterium]|nr:hypothetical protein [Spirochaetales bacterium]
MKKLFLLLTVLLIVFTGTTIFAKGNQESSGPSYTDGVYYAQEENFAGSGWKYFVVISVENGKISETYWGGTNIQPQGDKRRMSENKAYGMVKYGKAASYWYEQAEAAEAWLLKNQDPAAFKYTDAEGHTDMLKTDAGTGVSVHVIEFYTLAGKALSGKAVPAGKIKANDYVVNVKLAPADNGWAAAADFIVANGTIVSVNLNAVNKNPLADDGSNANLFAKDKDGNPDPRKPLSKDELGEGYGMKAFAGSKFEWNEQAEMLEAYILKNQSVPEMKADATTDAIAGVSIHINDIVKLFSDAFGK